MSTHSPANAGFSLVELIVVIAIVSALTAIAVPHYAEYRAKAFDMRALEDLRNVAIAEEAYFAESERYLACANAACAILPGIARLSEGVSLAVEVESDTFSGTSTHPSGSGRLYRWESAEGGLVD